MISLFEKFYSSCMKDENEHFQNKGGLRSMLPLLLAVVTVEILLLLVGKFLWNNYLVPAVTITVLLRLLIN